MTNRQKAIALNRFTVVDGELVARVGYKRGKVRVRAGDSIGWGPNASYVSIAGSKIKVSDVIELLNQTKD